VVIRLATALRAHVVRHHHHQDSRTIVSARKTEIKRPINDALTLYQVRYVS
jgi:hypothetical protein